MAITNKTEATTGVNGVINAIPTNGGGNIQATNFHSYFGDLINWLFPGASTQKGAVLTASATNYSLEWNVLIPVGTIIYQAYKYQTVPFSVPDGYLLCDGSQVLIATYPDLYTLIGDDYSGGVIPTPGNFFLPNNAGDQFPITPSGVHTGTIYVASIIKY